MSDRSLCNSGNRLLQALPPSDLARLRPHRQEVEFRLGQTLYEADQSIEHVHFPSEGMISLLVPLEDGTLTEVGVVGREGLVGVAALMGSPSASHTALVQAPGRGLRLPAGVVREEMRRKRPLLDLVLRHSQAQSLQVSQTAVCNARHNLQERLARWLLMAHDRVEGDILPLTQEFLSMMLASRRAGVTVAANILQQAGAISYVRGRITVTDRKRLEAASCECHRMLKGQTEALLSGPLGTKADRQPL